MSKRRQGRLIGLKPFAHYEVEVVLYKGNVPHYAVMHTDAEGQPREVWNGSYEAAQDVSRGRWHELRVLREICRDPIQIAAEEIEAKLKREDAADGDVRDS